MAFVANIKKNIFIAAAKRGVILDTLLLLVTLSIFSIAPLVPDIAAVRELKSGLFLVAITSPCIDY
jgi:hypothetical protein